MVIAVTAESVFYCEKVDEVGNGKVLLAGARELQLAGKYTLHGISMHGLNKESSIGSIKKDIEVEIKNMGFTLDCEELKDKTW